MRDRSLLGGLSDSTGCQWFVLVYLPGFQLVTDRHTFEPAFETRVAILANQCRLHPSPSHGALEQIHLRGAAEILLVSQATRFHVLCFSGPFRRIPNLLSMSLVGPSKSGEH